MEKHPYFDDIPLEIFEQILNYTILSSVQSFVSVNKKWRYTSMKILDLEGKLDTEKSEKHQLIFNESNKFLNKTFFEESNIRAVLWLYKQKTLIQDYTLSPVYDLSLLFCKGLSMDIKSLSVVCDIFKARSSELVYSDILISVDSWKRKIILLNFFGKEATEETIRELVIFGEYNLLERIIPYLVALSIGFLNELALERTTSKYLISWMLNMGYFLDSDECDRFMKAEIVPHTLFKSPGYAIDTLDLINEELF